MILPPPEHLRAVCCDSRRYAKEGPPSMGAAGVPGATGAWPGEGEMPSTAVHISGLPPGPVT